MKKIIGVYNADGGFVGEIKYVLGKITRKSHCALCDITHGFSITGKREWKEFVSSYPVVIETKHLNEIDNEIRKYIDNNVPCILFVEVDKEGKVISKELIVNEKELLECNKEVSKLKKIIDQKLSHCIKKSFINKIM